MTCVEDIVLALVALTKTAYSPILSQSMKGIPSASEKLMGVGLMSHIPDHLVPRCLKDIVQGNGQLHRTQAGG